MKKLRGQIVIDKILDTAERLFYEQGYCNTGINQVIEEADIAKASLYKHFESKTDLLVAYLQRFHERWFGRLEAFVHNEPNPKNKLLAVIDYHRERQQIREFGGCPFIKANEEAGATDPRVRAEIQRAKLCVKVFIAELVAQSGHKRILADDELTQLLFLAVEGGVVEASIFKQTNDLEFAKDILQKLI